MANEDSNANGCLHYAELILNEVPAADPQEQLVIACAARELVQIARTFIAADSGPAFLSWEAGETLACYCPEFAATLKGGHHAR